MEYENLIYDFVEGKLESAREQEFFLAMATNDELRSELRQTMALESAFHKDAAGLKPPARSTARLFASLGLPVPSNVGPSGISTASGAHTTAVSVVKSSVIAKFSHIIFSTLLTGAAAVIVYLSVIKPDINLLEMNYSNSLAANDSLRHLVIEKNTELERISTSANTPVITSREVAPQVYRNAANTPADILNNNLNSNIIVQSNDKKETENNTSNPLNENTIVTNENRDIESAFERVQIPGNKLQYGNSILANNIKSIEPIYMKSIESSGSKIGLSVEFKGFGEQPDGNPRINQVENTLFNNMGITVFKNLPFISDNLYIGADIRQESFYQTWEGIKPVDGLKYRFSQYPNFISAGAAIRYVFVDSKYFDAFAQAYAGINSVGSFGRGLIGFKVSYNNDFYFIFGFEASQMWYNASGKNGLTTAKYGINYGIGFNY